MTEDKTKERFQEVLTNIIRMIVENQTTAWEDDLEGTKSIVVMEDFERNVDVEEGHPDYDPSISIKYNGWFERLQELAGIKPQSWAETMYDKILATEQLLKLPNHER